MPPKLDQFIHGSIYKITLENFMTYSYVEFFPGQSLNFIIGPNGSGKSSIISAIVLGLGGKPCDLERASKASSKTKISSFIKKGTEEAKIEIELYYKGKPNTIIITTTLNRSKNKNILYQKDHEPITKADLLKCVSEDMRIQVSNLCQVLPQERLQDFSKMNSHDLLVNTIFAISNIDGVKMIKDLIKKSTEIKDLERENLRLYENIKKEQKQNTTDEPKVTEWEDYLRLRGELEMYEKKNRWLSYLKLDKDLINLKEKVECKSKVIKELEENKGEELKKKEVIVNKKRRDIESLNKIEKEIEVNKNSIKSKMRQLKIKQDSLMRRDDELKVLNDELMKLEQDLTNFINEHGDESSLQNRYNNKDEAIKKLERDILSIENDKEELEKLKNKYETRVLLKEKYNDTYLAVKWLEENRSLFKHRVYNPMLLEIDFENEEDAKFLENTVSNKDLTAFCFEDTEDMENFLKKVRSELGYKEVNACKVSSETNLRPPPIDGIKQYGFSRYVWDTFLAPPALRQFLCARYAVHAAPLGAARDPPAMPGHVQLYFTDKHRVSVKRSAYSGLDSKYITFIRPSILLKSYNARISSIVKRLNKFGSLERNRDKLNQEKKSLDEIRKKIDELKKITKNVTEKRRLNEKQSEIYNMEVNTRLDKADITRALVEEQQELLQDVRRLHAAELYRGKFKERIDNLATRRESDQCEEKIKVFDIELNFHKKSIDLVKKEINKVQAEINDCGDPNVLYKEEFDALPNDATELSSKIHKIKRSPKFNKDYSQDSLTVKAYYKRENEIKELNSKTEENKGKIQEKKNIIAEIQPRWLSQLEDHIRNINEKFAVMFDKLGYHGEVQLDTGKDFQDISGYGINIMVSFGAAAQRLHAAQSGGESATATACYLLALQAVADAPFRCLDEINQGMDEKNERNILKILMDVSSEENHCQYFVLSPKLLKNLEYNKSMKVHVVMSGEYNVSSEVWDADTFLENARDYGNNNSDVDI